jgi:hypothetical protein
VNLIRITLYYLPQLFLFLIFILVSDSAEIGKVFWERKMATQANVAREPAKADLALFPTVIDIHSNHTASIVDSVDVVVVDMGSPDGC